MLAFDPEMAPEKAGLGHSLGSIAVSENHDYPRIMVIDPTPFNRTRNNGIIKSNLFQGWPKDRLAQIDYSNIEPGFDVCSRYWNLKKLDILKALIGVSNYSGARAPSNKERDHQAVKDVEYENRPVIERKLSILPLNVRVLIGEAVFRLPTVISRPLGSWINDFKPEAIFSLLLNASILRMVVKVSQKRDIPILPYFTDDWVVTAYQDHPLGTWLRRSMRFWFDECLKRSPIRLTICEAMTEEYTRRYGGRFRTMMYPIDCENTANYHRVPPSDEIVRFVFIGSLEPGRWRSLNEIGQALMKLRLMGVDGELLIYTFPDEIKKHGRNLTLEPVMRIAGTASADEVLKLQREADVLVHVEGFDSQDRRRTKYSISTKLPQYMAAGACIFAYGPKEVASMKYIGESEIGLAVGDPDMKLLCAALSRIISESSLRRSLGQRSRRFALENHESAAQRERFRQAALRACQAYRSHYNKQ